MVFFRTNILIFATASEVFPLCLSFCCIISLCRLSTLFVPLGVLHAFILVAVIVCNGDFCAKFVPILENVESMPMIYVGVFLYFRLARLMRRLL